MKKRYSSKKRYVRRRKIRRSNKRSGPAARRQQRQATTWIRKKYTKVFVMDCEGGSDVWETTVSLIGGKNSNAVADTYTLNDVNQDSQLKTDMGLYQFFRISGVAIKMFFPMPTDVASSPVQWACAYSASDVLLPAIAPDRVQTLATYQTGSCSQTKPISRYYNTTNALRRFGIQYCSTSEFIAGDFGTSTDLYGAQLLANTGSSVNLKVYRQTAAISENTIGRLQLTYYVTYKGNKGKSSLINP